MTSLKDIRDQIEGLKCENCGKKFGNVRIAPDITLMAVKLSNYDFLICHPHPYGVDLENFSGRQGVYVVCGKCEHQNALWDLLSEEELNE